MKNTRRAFLSAALLVAFALQASCQEESGDVVDSPPTNTTEEDPCAPDSIEDYNLGLHIGSVFILLGVSLLGSFLPVILGSRSHNTALITLVKMGTFFGFGTILATAFIHMLTPAAEKLSSECLPTSFTEGYESWPYLFALIAVLFMQLIDFGVEGVYQSAMARKASSAKEQSKHDHKGGVIDSVYSSRHDLAHAEQPEEPESQLGSDEETGSAHNHDHEHACAVHGHGCKSLLAHSTDASAVAGIYIMEAGILAHSILIGISLGVTGGSSFITLLIALSFHQAFEGFAIGSAAIDTGLSLKKASILSLLYSLTTPIGIAIGIGIRSTYNANSDEALYIEGIFDSLCAGILLYVGLVELLNPLMTQSKWLRAQRWYTQVCAFLCLYAGAAAMAVIGKWA